MAYSHIFGYLVGILGAISSGFLIGFFIFFPPSEQLAEWPYKLVISIFFLFNFIASCNWINGVRQRVIQKMKRSLIWWTIPALSINYCILMLIVLYILNIPLSERVWFGVSSRSLCFTSVGFLVFYVIAYTNYHFLKRAQWDESDSPRPGISYSKTESGDEFRWQRR